MQTYQLWNFVLLSDYFRPIYNPALELLQLDFGSLGIVASTTHHKKSSSFKLFKQPCLSQIVLHLSHFFANFRLN